MKSIKNPLILFATATLGFDILYNLFNYMFNHIPFDIKHTINILFILAIINDKAAKSLVETVA
jgi:hypothetical protein